jgi:hypothetical protein
LRITEGHRRTKYHKADDFDGGMHSGHWRSNIRLPRTVATFCCLNNLSQKENGAAHQDHTVVIVVFAR